jgi:hypothetical protein
MKKEVIIMSHDDLTRAYYDRMTRIQNEITRALKRGAYWQVMKLIAAHRITVYRRDRMTREIDAAAEYICR